MNKIDTQTIEGADVKYDIEFLKGRFADAQAKLDSLIFSRDKHVEYCGKEDLIVDVSGIEKIDLVVEQAKRELDSTNIDLHTKLSVCEYEDKKTEYLRVYRALVIMLAYAMNILDWRSAAYDQSKHSEFFGVEAQQKPSHMGVNYSRWRTDHLRPLETQMREVTGLTDIGVSFLMTSSAMAAHTLAENYLIRNALNAGDTILLPRGVLYLEVRRQIETLSHLYKVEKMEEHETDDIISEIREKKPKVVYIDVMEHSVTMCITDAETVVRTIAKDNLTEDIYFVFDGTITSGKINPFEWVEGNKHVKIVYYSSCSKYLQLGLDLTMSGFLATNVSSCEELEQMRTNTGTVLYESSAYLFPKYDSKTFDKRMERLSKNALDTAAHIEEQKDLSKYVDVYYPQLNSHHDYDIAQKHEWSGGIFFVAFRDIQFASHTFHNDYISIFLDCAREKGLSVVKGDSFGFSLPRMYASAFGKYDSSFLRISAGDRSEAYTKLFAETMVEAFHAFIKKHNAKPQAASLYMREEIAT